MRKIAEKDLGQEGPASRVQGICFTKLWGHRPTDLVQLLSGQLIGSKGLLSNTARDKPTYRLEAHNFAHSVVESISHSWLSLTNSSTWGSEGLQAWSSGCLSTPPPETTTHEASEAGWRRGHWSREVPQLMAGTDSSQVREAIRAWLVARSHLSVSFRLVGKSLSYLLTQFSNM